MLGGLRIQSLRPWSMAQTQNPEALNLEHETGASKPESGLHFGQACGAGEIRLMIEILHFLKDP